MCISYFYVLLCRDREVIFGRSLIQVKHINIDKKKNNYAKIISCRINIQKIIALTK